MKDQKFKLTTPVLFLVFNRLDTTKRVFEEIRKAKPTQLFIASDGPRKNKEGEREIVEKVRKYVLSQIDWKCNVKTLFRKENLGCRVAVSGAIDWFFKNVDKGIILEDDCLPSPSFFRFCQELLDKYEDNEEIMMIGGDNFIEENTKKLKESYYFSKNAHIWGWATWRRAWKNYKNIDLNKLTRREIYSFSDNLIEYLVNRRKISSLINKRVNTWDYQLDFLIKSEDKMTIVPKKNLVENIGFLQTKFTNLKPNPIDFRYLHRSRKKIDFPLIHPTELKVEKRLDKKTSSQNIKRIILKKVTWRREN